MNGIGARAVRNEDGRFVTGQGCYVADVALPNALHVAILRSPHPHARIVSIDPGRALALPGVEAVLTAEDIGAVGPIPVRSHPMPELIPFLQYPLARGKVRYVGDPVAVVAAADPYLAEDALEAIEVVYEPLPALQSAEAALEPDAPILFESESTNVVLEFAEEVGEVDAVFTDAAIVVSGRFAIQRHGAVPLEPRGLAANYDSATGRLTVWGPTKVPFGNRSVVARLLDLPEHRIRFIETDVGGGFGARGEIYPEDLLVPLLALRTGRPVKWVEDRRENLMALNHSREQIHDAELALDEDGRILGLRACFVNVMGGYIRTHGIRVPEISTRIYPGPYRIPVYRAEVQCVLTNKTPTGTYRAPGRFETNFVRERLIDMAADRLGIDRVELRRRNLVTAADMPHPLGTYDRGHPVVLRDVDAAATLERALDHFGWNELLRRRDEARSEGRRVGLGLGCYMEESGLGGSAPGEYARIAVDLTGHVTLYTGATSLGQGHETVLAQVVEEEIGVDYRDVTVVHGDTDRVPWGGGTFADRGAIVAANAVALAARKLRDRARSVAAVVLDVPEAEAEFAQGRASAPDGRGLSLAELSQATYSADFAKRGLDPGFEAAAMFYVTEHVYAPGVQIALVEVDEATGAVSVLEYATAHDVGRALNPAVVEGQLIGGAVQGLGGALLEEFVYSDDGQPLSTSFMDYLLPSSMDVAPVQRVLVLEDIRSQLNPLGVKGAGDAGPAGAGAAIASAVADALADLGISIDTLPLSPDRVRAAIREAAAV